MVSSKDNYQGNTRFWGKSNPAATVPKQLGSVLAGSSSSYAMLHATPASRNIKNNDASHAEKGNSSGAAGLLVDDRCTRDKNMSFLPTLACLR